MSTLAAGRGTQRSASSPLSSPHLLSLSDVSEDGPLYQPQSQSRRSSRVTRPKARTRRSMSAPTPQIDSALLAHEFTVEPPSEPRALPFETKHAGPASLKRIFIGPHLVGAQDRRRGKQRETPLDSVNDDHSSSGSDSGDEDDLAGIDDQGRTARMRRRIERHKQRKGAVPRRVSVGSAVTQPGASAKLTHWTGSTFEIGGDIRDAARRRLDAAQRREETTRALAATLAGTGATAATSTFATAHSSSVASTSKLPTRGTYTLNEPSKKIEDTLPALTHALLRRKSELPSDAVTLAPHSTPTDNPAYPPTPSRGILRASSTLGIGFPSSSDRPTTGAKTVHLPADVDARDQTTLAPPVPGPGDRPPAPIDSVLSRPSVQIGHVDQDILAAGQGRDQPRSRDAVLRKERMLVRAEWTEREVRSFSLQSRRVYRLRE